MNYPLTILKLTVPKYLRAFVLMGVGLTEWIVAYLDPEKNLGNFTGAVFGALVIRFAYPRLPLRISFSGWLAGVILAVLYGPSLVDSGLLGSLKPAAVWGTLALTGDGIIQLIGWAIRFTTKVGDYAVENPGEAFDQGLERAEKLVNVWVRIKAGALDLLGTILNRGNPNKPHE